MLKSISSTKKIFFLFVSVLLIGASCNPFADSPEENLTQMRKNMAEVKTLKYKATASVEQTSKQEGSAQDKQGLSKLMGSASTFDNFDLTLSGQTAVNGYVNPNSKMDISVNPAGSDQKVNLNLRQIGDKSYIKLGSLGPLQSSPIAAMFGSMIVGKWLELPQQMDTEQKEQQEDELTEQQRQQVKNLVKNTSFLKFVEDMGTEQVNGTETMHYKVELKPEEIKKFNNKLEEITGEKQEDEESFRKNLEKLKGKQWDVWIGADDKMLYKLKVKNLPSIDDKGQKKAEIDLTTTFSDFNSEINVEKPENVQSIKDLMGGMLGGQQQNNGSGFLPSGSNQNQGSNFNFQGNTGDGGAMGEDMKKKIKEMQMAR